MVGIDFYKSVNFDSSLALKYPKGMTSVLTAVRDILIAKGNLIVEVTPTVANVRELASQATRDPKTYYQIATTDSKVWSILKESVNRDDIRVLALIHGKAPDNLPENILVIDVGRSLHEKVSKSTVSSISDSLLSKTRLPAGKPEELYYGIQSLCYEVLYSPEYKVFGPKISNLIPKAHAFNFMYNPPEVLTSATSMSAVHRFVEDVHGWME